MRRIFPAIRTSCWMAALSVVILMSPARAADYNAPAHFRVIGEAVNVNPPAFTATVNGIGNSLVKKGAGFEPIVYRAKYMADKDSPNRVIAPANEISHWGTLREGVLDGADVRVYRIENGVMRLVREDRVADGGFHVGDWTPVTSGDKVLSGDSRQYRFRWDPWSRPDADYYFTVRAIDHSGNLSPPAATIAVKSPKKLTEGRVSNPVEAFRKSKLTFDSSPPAAPKNLRGLLSPTGTLTLIWDAPGDWNIAGYKVYRSDYAPRNHNGHYLQLAGKAASAEQYIKAGDMVIVSKKFYESSRKRFFSNRVWDAFNEYQVLKQPMVDFFSDEAPEKRSWKLVKHPTGTQVEEPGETYLQVKLGFGETASVGIYNHSGTAQNWYDVLEKDRLYKMEVWLRKEGMGRVKFVSDGKSDGVGRDYLQAGKEWRKIEKTFAPWKTDPGDRPYQMRLELTGPGVFSIDNFRIYRADADYLDLLPEEYQRLRQSGMSALRTHGLIKSGRSSYDIEQLTNPGGVISGTVRLNTLPQTLAIMEKAGVRPWLQIEPHLGPDEWRALVEYLAAGYDPVVDTPATKPWAYKRYSQGRKKPWVEAFDRIYFELGNETWNRLFRPWVFDEMPDHAGGKRYSAGQVYGLYQEYVISQLRASPHWKAAGLDDKFEFVIGGWSGQVYGRHAASKSPSSHHLTYAAYNGGWDEAEGLPKLNDESFFNVLNQVSQSAVPNADVQAGEALKNRGADGKAYLPGTYEAGPGYVLNGLNGAKVSKKQAAEQERVMKSLAAGTATLDSFLARAYRGFRLQNFFTFAAGDYWKSHARWYQGGQAYPSWQLLELFNRQGRGDILKTETISVPTTSLKKFNRRRAVAAAPLVAAYATSQGDRFNLFLVSRKLSGYPKRGDDGYTPVTVDLPFKAARSLTLYHMQGDPRANNVEGDNVRIEKIPLPTGFTGGRLSLSKLNGADDRGIPPAATYLYVFEGVSSQ